MIKEDRYYRPDEVAEMLAVEISTVYRLVREPGDPLPAVRLGERGHIRILGRDLGAWLERWRVDN